MCETKNENSSNLLRGISENGGILFYGIDSTAIVRRMEQLHKTSAVTTAALGRLLTGVAMMGQMLKSDSDSVTVQIKGGGPAGRILAVSNGAGDVKGYVENSIVELPPRADGHLNVGAAVGKDGTLDVIRDLGMREPYIGQVAVGAVILNRMEHPSFPNTLSGVIYQPGAFSCLYDGGINAAVADSAYRAARDAINGQDPSGGAIYYYNPAKSTNQWIFSRPVITVIGQHRFCS